MAGNNVEKPINPFAAISGAINMGKPVSAAPLSQPPMGMGANSMDYEFVAQPVAAAGAPVSGNMMQQSSLMGQPV